jgi:hypothetical protein
MDNLAAHKTAAVLAAVQAASAVPIDPVSLPDISGWTRHAGYDLSST